MVTAIICPQMKAAIFFACFYLYGTYCTNFVSLQSGGKSEGEIADNHKDIKAVQNIRSSEEHSQQHTDFIKINQQNKGVETKESQNIAKSRSKREFPKRKFLPVLWG